MRLYTITALVFAFLAGMTCMGSLMNWLRDNNIPEARRGGILTVLGVAFAIWWAIWP